MPRSFLPSLSWVGGHLLCLIRFRRGVVEDNLVLAWGAEKAKVLLPQVYRHFALTVLEILRLPRLGKEAILTETELIGLEHLEKAVAAGKGVIVVSAHTGNWEMCLSAIASRGHKTSVIVKRMRNIDDAKLYQRIRGQYGVNSMIKEESGSQIIRLFRDGHAVAFVIDQRSSRKEGVFATLFGKPASTYASPAILAYRLKIPVLALFAHRRPDGTHAVIIQPELELPRHLPQDQFVPLATQMMQDCFERHLRQFPDQWIWMHRRWNKEGRNNSESAPEYISGSK
ncbi:MAG: hypothetical protein RL095_2546 [Verrucomicrobiota bacterium]